MADKQVLREFAADEQAIFVDWAKGLTEEELNTASLCSDWSVGDVVLHCALHTHRTSWGALKGTEKSMQREIEQQRGMDPADLIEWFARPITSPSLGVQLAELLIHQQDARRPLRSTREIPADRLAEVLDFCLSRPGSIGVAKARKRAHGLRLEPDDLAWSWGSGSAVHGHAEAILLAVNGREAALCDLSGDGVTTLASRIG